jgi:hypothetical protein
MSFNGSGTFLINTAGQPVVAGTVISSTAFNALTADLATGLSTVITKDGQTTVTANIPMSTYKFTGLGVGSAATDSANLSQVQSTVTKLLTSVSGTDTITAVGAPVVAAYAAGQMFYFVATGDNTGAVTLNIDSLGAKAVTRDGSVALAAGDIKSGEVVVVVYDGTRFQVVSQLNSAGDARFANVSIASSLYVGGVSTFVGNAGFSANVSIASALSVGGVAAITGATTIGGNLTLNGGTANGVLYLNGSKVATSGAVLVFDGTNLGLGAGSSASKVTGVSGSGTGLTVSGGVPTLAVWDTSNASNYFNLSQVGVNSYLWGIPAGALIFGTDNTERMRLNSTGLGIGTTSPAYKLTVQSAIDTYAFNIRDTIGNERVLIGSRSTAPIDNITPVQMGNDNTGNLFLSSRTNSASGINFYTNAGTAASLRATLDSSGNLGIGTTTIGSRVTIGDPGTGLAFSNAASGNFNIGLLAGTGSALAYVYQRANSDLLFGTNNTERARITSGGDLLVGTTATTIATITQNALVAKASNGSLLIHHEVGNTGSDFAAFGYNGAVIGSIYPNSASTVAYATSSDYRLKNTVAPMTGALAKVALLKPCTYKWNADGSDGQGFIAHELAEVVPDCVVGEKDAVDAEGKPRYQGVDTSFLVATLTAAIQELTARVAQLESK